MRCGSVDDSPCIRVMRPNILSNPVQRITGVTGGEDACDHFDGLPSSLLNDWLSREFMDRVVHAGSVGRSVV
jgi:hypothetical protein